MVNNSTNINNDISHEIFEHRKEPNHMTLEIQVLNWYMHTYVASVHILFISCKKKQFFYSEQKDTYQSSERLFLHTMQSGEVDHTYHLECCLGETDKELSHKYGYC